MGKTLQLKREIHTLLVCLSPFEFFVYHAYSIGKLSFLNNIFGKDIYLGCNDPSYEVCNSSVIIPE